MPVVFVHMLKGRSRDQKSRLVTAITQAMVDIAGADPQNVHVVIDEADGEDWGRAGVLIADGQSAQPESDGVHG